MQTLNKIEGFDTSLLEKNLMEKLQKQEAYRISLLNKIIQITKNYFTNLSVANKVYLFGSLITKNQFTKKSDIDIAITGIKNNQFFKTYADLNRMIFDHNVDLVELEHCIFSNKIIKSGKRII